MKKTIVVYLFLIVGSFNFLMAMDQTFFDLKLAWANSLHAHNVSLVTLKCGTRLKYESIKWDDASRYFECRVNVTDKDTPSHYRCLDVSNGFLIDTLDKNISDMRAHEQEAQKIFGNSSRWVLKNKVYKTKISIPLDSYGNVVHHCAFKAYKCVYDTDTGLAVALIDSYQPSLTTFRTKVWCIYATYKINTLRQLGAIDLVFKVLKKLPKFDANVLNIAIMQGGKKILFFLADGTIKIISPYEVKLPFLLDARCKKIADLFFGFK